MKILIVYYSRSGVTKKVARKIQEKLNCDICEITDNHKYEGAIGWLKGGYNASLGRLSDIEPLTKNPKDYDLIIIGSPVWASKVSCPVSTFIYKYKNDLDTVAGFVTCKSGGDDKALKMMSDECGKILKAKMGLTTVDIEKELDYEINKFVEKLN